MENISVKNSLINWLKDNYTKMPEPVVYMIGKVGNRFGYKARYGKSFSSIYEELERTEFLPREELDKIVLEKLIGQIQYAYEHVPYYRDVWKNLHIENVANFSDIACLPLIDKEIVKKNTDALISDLFKKEELIQKKTSGSTGMPLAVYMNKDTTLKEWAFVTHIWKQIGYNSKSTRLIMRELDDQSRGKCYFDPIKNEMRIDITAMTDENLDIYCSAIEKYKPDFVHGYPSATLTFCQYVEKHGLKHQFKGVLPSSEGMSADEAEYIRSVLKCPILSFYGHTERLVMAGQCKDSEAYHVEPLYGYVELVDETGKIIHETGVTGEIVATGFCNTAMPLVRYRTGDLAQWGEACPHCGKHYRILKKLEGRTTEYHVDADNIKIALTSFHYSFYEQHLKAFQFYQEVPGEVTVRYIAEDGFNSEDKEYILKTLTEDANDKIQFVMEPRTELSRKKSGKRELIIQKLK